MRAEWRRPQFSSSWRVEEVGDVAGRVAPPPPPTGAVDEAARGGC